MKAIAQSFRSKALKRKMQLEFFDAAAGASSAKLLILNDGQLSAELGLGKIIETLSASYSFPVLCVAIHAGRDRKQEYGISTMPDYEGRGRTAGRYRTFVVQELLPYIGTAYPGISFNEIAIAGFSLGGLSAFDIAWHHSEIFGTAGVFSGSFWWRMKSLDDPDYSDEQHRIVHKLVRESTKVPPVRFFFQTGTEDEQMDRNGNGIIDSIDDTTDLIRELLHKGHPSEAIHYYEIEGGKHDAATWSAAIPVFLEWAWGG